MMMFQATGELRKVSLWLLARESPLAFSLMWSRSDVFGLFSNNAGRCGPVQTLRRSLGLLWRRSDALDYVGSEALKIRLKVIY